MGSASQVADWKVSALAEIEGQRTRRLDTTKVFQAALVAGLLAICVRPLGDPDLFWHLKTGQMILSSGTIPVADPFSHTAIGAPWTAHEYLSEMVMAATYQICGWRGLQLFFGVIAACACWLVYLRCQSSRTLAAAGLLLGVLAATPSFGARPQMFTFLFASAFLFLLERAHASVDRRWLAPLPFILALWANLHAGFVLGLGMIWLEVMLAFWQSRSSWRRLQATNITLTALACSFAALLNPHGWRLVAYAFETLRSPAQQSFIQEWASPNFHQVMFWPFGILIVVLMLTLAARREPLSLRQGAYLAIFFLASLRSGRHIPIFVLVAVPILASQPVLRAREGSATKRAPALAFVALALVMAILAGFRILATVAAPEAAFEKSYPVSAVDFMRQHHTPSPLFNFYDWGGYLIWSLPSQPVYIDGRADVYGDPRLERYVKTYSGMPGWDSELKRQGIRSVLVQPESAIASLLKQDPSWRVVFADSIAIVFEKYSGPSTAGSGE